MKRLRPSATAGAPGSVAPMVSKSPPETCARYQVDGSRALRCGSFASIGLPLAVSVPSTTQLFEPSASLVAAEQEIANSGLALRQAQGERGGPGRRPVGG